MADKIRKKTEQVCVKDTSQKQMLKEAHMQENALIELIKWRNTVGLIAIFCLILCYCAFSGTIIPTAVGIISSVVAILCLAAALVIHCSIRHGRKNIVKIRRLAGKDLKP